MDGGKELQRCLYAFAVKALLGGDVEISASLLYSRAEVDLRLADAEGTLTQVIGYLNASFAYDVASDTFTPTQKDAKCGAACHEIAAAKDYIFHPYQHR